jgi:hypothetical protein
MNTLNEIRFESVIHLNNNSIVNYRKNNKKYFYFKLQTRNFSTSIKNNNETETADSDLDIVD